MAAVWFRLRSELRTRWRGLVVVALLAGVAGGVTPAAIAGARRTDAAYQRLGADTGAPDVLVNPDLGTDSALDASRVERLPQVADAGRLSGYFIAPADVRSEHDFIRFGADAAGSGAAERVMRRVLVLLSEERSESS